MILNTQGVLDSAVVPAKGIRTGCPDAPSDGFVSHGKRERHKSVGLLLGLKRLPGGIPFFFVRRHIYTASGVLFLSLMAMRYFMFVMMTFGGSMVIATLLTAVRSRGR